jgi:hypothetical protein
MEEREARFQPCAVRVTDEVAQRSISSPTTPKKIVGEWKMIKLAVSGKESPDDVGKTGEQQSNALAP